MRGWLWLWVAVAGCTEVPEKKGCTDPDVYYPDADRDGLGEPTGVYWGCDPPEGWVPELGPGDVGSGTTGPPVTETAHTGDTG